ncbi:uncharacterized protein [Dermacentor albipictus]|uniref:uncharacterized protein isoform X2 n=1 Tax=Dermacentor albipictus TaxID=60249 RepID=UPI0031FCB980
MEKGIIKISWHRDSKPHASSLLYPDVIAMNQPSDADSPTVALLDVKLPPFWTGDPELWFVQVESQFAARRITADSTKYHHVVGNLPPATASEVRDLLLTPPAENAYQTLKEIRRITPTEPERLQQLLREAELGDRRPSQLLRHMQQLAGDATASDGRLVRELFLRSLPTSVRIGLTASGETDLAKMAELADKLMAPSANSLQEMREELSRLADTVAALHSSGNQRPRQRTASQPQQRRVCWYHRKFCNAARNCVSPCENSGNAPGQH